MHDEPLILFDFPRDPCLIDDGQVVEQDIPVVPLTTTVLFPYMLTPLFINREHSLRAVEAGMERDQTILAVTQRDPDADEIGLHDLYPIGVEATIQRVLKMPDGTTSVVVQGVRRMRLLKLAQERPYLQALAVPVSIAEEQSLAVEAMRRAVLSLFEKVVRLSRILPDDSYMTALNVPEPGWLADMIASTLPLDIPRRQEILETIDPEERLRRLSMILSQELDVLELETRIHNQVQKEVDRSQREFFLREQLKVIQRELGQMDPVQREIILLRERIMSSDMPEAASTRAFEELDRMEAMPISAPEYSIIRTYLDWLLDLPWGTISEDTCDLRTAARILHKNHYGLPKVKERMLEFIAVRQLAGTRLKAPILCFVGPPGVGKTSLGRSIGEALGRKFVRLSLGGIHDEAEIRGHRRTYVGALPGRIIRTMKEAGTINPVFTLDEVDKLGSDFRGDPASALLEVLDPEQNNAFSDHYLDIHYDLSKVFFITTANLLDPIPYALLDRMEVIEIPGYTEEEKLQIARKFLLPKQWEANGLPPGSLRLSETSLRQLIRTYTYEAGVRELERAIGALCRKTARRIAEHRRYTRVVYPSRILRDLGPPPYSYGQTEQEDEVGVATSMVWTSNGGDIIRVEATLMEGKGNLTLTGQLGEVMQESGQTALSYARSHARGLGIDPKRFDKTDIHINVPEGAVPKDGPSAGITMATALVSALLMRPIRRNVAMTGEVTLRGRVLPVGGIKEKVLGSHRAGVDTIVLPQKNERDLIEVPQQVRRKLTFVLVSHMDQVLDTALGPAPPPKPRPEPENPKNPRPS
ncbi:MAG: endopeptidase La, partial [Chloroflexaceae bacterium]|nr:endopeptidase La [Chloroflexaceae bacterium]